MKILALMILVIALSTASALAEHPHRDWNQYMPLPGEEQLAQPGTLRSPYVAFFPEFSEDKGMTAFSMDFRIDHDPDCTYICPVVWRINTSALLGEYTQISADYGEELCGYFGFQVLNDGTKVVIMSLWDAFCQDDAGNVDQIKARLLFPVYKQGNEFNSGYEFNPDNNQEGSFVQCIYEYDWEVGKDYHFVLDQTTGDSGTECFTLWLMDLEGETPTEMFCFDSGLRDIWIDGVGGFVENFNPATALWPRSMEFWNVKGRMLDDGKWENAKSVQFSVNGSIGFEDYEGSWNFGQDEHCCWIITSGIPGLCEAPKDLGPYIIPTTENDAPN